MEERKVDSFVSRGVTVSQEDSNTFLERTKSNENTDPQKRGGVAFKRIFKKTEEEQDWIDLAQDR